MKIFDGRKLKFTAPLLLYLCVLVAFPVYRADAQLDNRNEEWRWVQFTTESGLPSNQIISIIESQRGTMWVNTTAGIAWFDGYRWIPVDKSKGLPEKIFDIRPGADDSILVFSDRAYHGTKTGFRPLMQDIDIGTVVHIRSDSFLVINDGLPCIVRSGATTVRLPFPCPDGTTMNRFWKTRSGVIWAETSTGLYKLVGNIWKVVLPTSDKLLLNSIIENREGTGIASVRLPARMRGLWEWSAGKPPALNNQPLTDYIMAMDFGPDSTAIVILKSGEVRWRKNGKWDIPFYVPPPMRNCQVMKYTSDGSLWVGTEKGLYAYRGIRSCWSSIRYDKPDYRNRINEVLVTRDSCIWEGTANGIVIINPSGERTWIPTINGTELFSITGLGEDIEGNVWVSSGSSFPGAYCWNGKQWNHVLFGSDSLLTSIHRIMKGTDGSLWFMGLSLKHYIRSQGTSNVFQLVQGRVIDWGREKGLQFGVIYSIAQGHDGSIWFGGVAGIARLSHGTKREWKTGDGIHLSRIFTLSVDRSGRCWFGEQDHGAGLGMIDVDGMVKYYTSDDGLVNNYVWEVKVDRQDRVWATTAGGLACFDHGRWISYDERSGLSYGALWGLLPIENRILVGTLGQGLAILDLTVSHDNTPVVLFESPVVERENSLIRWKAYAYMAELSPFDVPTRYCLDSGMWSDWSTARSITFPSLPAGSHTVRIQAKGVTGNYYDDGYRISFTIPPPLWYNPKFFIPVSIVAVVFVLSLTLQTLRKRHTDRALRSSEEKFRTVAETTMSAIFIYNEEAILFANPAAGRMTRYSQEEILTKRMQDFLTAECTRDSGTMETLFKDNGSGPCRGELKIVTGHGEERWIDFTCSSIQFQGTPSKIGTAFDITERKQAEVRLLRYQQDLRRLTSQLSATEERERKRIATILHGTIGHSLAFCRIKILEMESEIQSLGHKKEFSEIVTMLEQTLHEARSLTRELSPPVLHTFGLIAALEWLAERFENQYKLRVCFEGEKLPKESTEAFQDVLFNAAREIMVNIIKHAHATEARMLVRREEDLLMIEIEDNGTGFDTSILAIDAYEPANNREEGFGLFNIRERITYLGGHVEVYSHTGSSSQQHRAQKFSSGTLVILSIPLLIKEIRSKK